jgi:hypothetical protein
MTATTSATQCPSCGTTFYQPDDPGKRRVYCSSACRQRAYRARGGRASGTRQESARARERREQSDAWAREEARREQARERMRRNRGRGQERIVTPPWCQEQAGDTAKQARARRTARLLYTRAGHPGTPEPEAAACRGKADEMRARHGL